MFLINILLVDDHALFSKSLEIALSDYSEIETFDSINDVSQLDNYIVSKKPEIRSLNNQRRHRYYDSEKIAKYHQASFGSFPL